VEDCYAQGNDIGATRENGMLTLDKYRRVLGSFDAECVAGGASRARKVGSCPDARMVEFGLFSHQVGGEKLKDGYPQLQLIEMSEVGHHAMDVERTDMIIVTMG